MRHSAKGNIFLILAAFVWGSSLVAQKIGLVYMDPFVFTALRCLLGGISMLPLVIFVDRMEKHRKNENEDVENTKEDGKHTLKAALCCGSLICTLILLQQFGLPHTTVGKAGFITALYILLTPLLGLFIGRKTSRNLWIGVLIGLVGMYMLCIYEGFSAVTFGDVMMFCASFFCAIHIHTIDYFVRNINPVKLSCYQFLVAGCISAVLSIFFGEFSLEAIKLSIFPIIYASVFSCALAYTLQTIGQKLTDPNLACLIVSLEAVFSLFSGWIFLGEVLSANEYAGCVLMFLAIIISQLPQGKRKAGEDCKECIDMEKK